jgi:anti-sigma factor RsiW/TolA-binding protein
MSPPTCHEVSLLLDDFRRGELLAAETEMVELHLAGCDACREAAEIWAGFADALGSAELDPLPPLVERRIAKAAADARQPRVTASTRRTRVAIAIAAALGIAAGIALVLVLTGTADEQVEQRLPVAEKEAAPEPEEPEAVAERPTTGVLVAASGRGRQQITVDEVTSLWAEEGSKVSVERLDQRFARFRLASGRVVAEVGPHPDGDYRFIVATPSGEVEAKGTIFAVEVLPGGAELTRVIRGVVEVRSLEDEGERFEVRAGESGAIGGSSPAPLDSAAIERDVCLLRGCGPEPEPAAVEPEVAAAAAEPDQAPQSGGGAAGASTKPAKVASTKGSGAPAQAAPKEPSKQTWEVETLVALALSHRKAGMYPMAAETYRTLIRKHGGSAAAKNALVSLGQLELVELARPKEALNQFERYLTLAPGGLLAEEARLGRVRAYARMGRSQDVIGAASDYLRLHLGGYAGAEVTRLRGDARRQVGDCLAAIEDYRQVQSLWPTSKENARAAKGLAACRAEP